MKKAIVWTGVALILMGTIVGVIADAISDASYSTLIESYRTGDESKFISSLEQDQNAGRVGIVAGILVSLGLAFAFAGLLFEESYRPIPQYYPGTQQGVYPPQQPPQYFGQPPSQYPPSP